MTSPQTPAGWYPDPEGSGQQRYWDGGQWTQHYSGGGGAPGQAGAPAHGAPQQGLASQGQPGYAQAAPRTPPTPAPAAWWAVPVLALLALIGAAGRWVSAGEFAGTDLASVNGLEGDGWFTVFFVVIAVVLLVVWRQGGQRWAAIAAGVLSLLAAIFPLIYIIDPGTGAEGALADVIDFSTGWGAYLAFLMCLALAVLSFYLSAQRRRPA